MIDVNETAVLNLAKKPENNNCMDCGSPDPQWASYNIGIFVCTRCAGIHRGLGVHISKIKHLKLDKWEDIHIKQMEEMGNLKAQAKYEKYVPIFYRKPREFDPHILIDQWIKAKYVREEFIYPEQQTYLKGRMEGYLLKRGKSDPAFQPRLFTLSENEGTLKYHIKEKKSPKAVIRLSELNIVLSPEKVGQPNCMQLTYLKEGTTRHIYVQHANPQIIIDWYQGIRCAKLHRLQVAFPAASESQLLPMLSNDFAMEGWLWKTGLKAANGYKKRWFTLDNRKLMYHEHPMDAYPKGEIFLGNMLSGYSVRVGVPPDVRDQGFSFTLRTPCRTFYFSASKEGERDSWIQVIKDIISKQLTPQDNFMHRLMPSMVNSIYISNWWKPKKTCTRTTMCGHCEDVVKIGTVVVYSVVEVKRREIGVSFPTKREAEIAYQVLVVDKEPPRSQVLKLLNLENKSLKIQFTAPTPHQLKIGVNGFLDHLMLVCETMVHFGPPESF